MVSYLFAPFTTIDLTLMMLVVALVNAHSPHVVIPCTRWWVHPVLLSRGTADSSGFRVFGALHTAICHVIEVLK